MEKELFGSLFEKRFKRDPRTLSITEINEIAVKAPQYKKRFLSFVSKRGDIFKNHPLEKSIDTLFDQTVK